MTAKELEEYLNGRASGAEVLALLDKLGFTREFVAKNVLSRAEALTVAQTAMLWQGMPNKHDRKRTRQLFDALTQAGLLTADAGEETWHAAKSTS